MKGLFGIDTLANPEALLLLVLIPAYLFWYVRYYRKQRLVIRMSYDPMQFEKPTVDLTWLRFIPRILQLASIGLLIFALARPQQSRQILEREVEAIDIMLLLDVSGSMEAQDYLPNRLEVAKKTAVSFIEGRENDQIGLVLFAAEALSYTPLTLDHDFLVRMVNSVGFNLLPRQGTAIGTAVAMGINRMRTSDSPSRIMVLLTDGANNRGDIDPITAAKLAAEHDLKMYCIGIGQVSVGTQVAQREPDLDEATLQQMAQFTGGNYYRVSNARGLNKVFQEISRLETRSLPDIQLKEVKDLYPTFLKTAIILLVLSFVSMLTFIYNPLEQ
ncbi:MAG: VWA domain-containing protein [Bacteroidota bacterium]